MTIVEFSKIHILMYSCVTSQLLTIAQAGFKVNEILILFRVGRRFKIYRPNW